MRGDLARKLVEAGQEADVDVEFYEAYSGRGMYGSSTDAIACDFGELAQCVALLAKELTDEENDELVEELGKMRWDSLGLGQIFY